MFDRIIYTIQRIISEIWSKFQELQEKKSPLEKGHEGVSPRKPEENGEGVFPGEIQVRVSVALPSQSALCLFAVL